MPKDDTEAIKWYRIAAAQGSTKADEALGHAYRDGWGVDKKDPTEAAKWFHKAAYQGLINSTYNLALIYDSVHDEINASKWYAKALEQANRAAQRGDTEAQNTLAHICAADGKGVPKNETEALKWRMKAAEKGHINSQIALAYAYFTGIGVPRKDDTKAVK